VIAVLVLGSLLPAAVSSPAAGALRITGRIEMPAGAAAAAIAAPGGARIELLPAALDYAAAMRRLAGEPAGSPLAATRADRTGAFELMAPGAGCYRVVVRAAGYLPVELALVPLVAGRELPAARLTAAVPIAIRALGPRDEPLAGVAVALQGMDAQPADGESWQPAERFGRTGVDGRVTLLWAAGETPYVSVLDPRYLGATRWLGDPAAMGGARPSETILRLRHRPELTLTLDALAPGGRAVSGALLRLEDGTPIAVAGSDGRLRITFDEPPDSRWRQAPTLESPSGELRGEMSWALAGGGALRVTLRPWRETTGALADGEDGHAPAGGVVWAERNDALGRISVLAAAAAGPDGRFRLRLPAGGDVQARAAAPGYLTRTTEVPGGTAPWRIGLERALELAGLVVDGAGRGIAGARVTARESERAAVPRPAVSSGPDGGFHLPGLAAGARYRLDAAAAGFAPASTTLASVPRPAAGKRAPPVRLVLGKGGAIAGVVVDGAGQPLPGVAVTLMDSDSAVVWRALAGREGSRETLSDRHGAFEIVNLSPGRYALIAHGPAFAATARWGLDLIAGTGPPLDAGRLVMEPAGTIEGVVTDRRGAPLPDADVMVFPSPRGDPVLERTGADYELDARSDREGRFRVAELRRGEAFDLYVSASGHLPARVRDVRSPTAEPLRVELSDGCRLRGRVLDNQRQPVFAARIGAADQGREAPPSDLPGMGLLGEGPGTATDVRGEFSLPGIAAGRVDLTVTAQGYEPARVQGLELAVEREAAPIEVVLERGSSVAGQVRDAAGHPIAGALVVAMPDFDLASFLRRDRSSSQPHCQSAADGRYRLEGLEPGKVQVSVVNRRVPRVPLDVQPGENGLDLVAEEEKGGVPVSGRVVDATGAPIEGASVALISQSADDSPYPYPSESAGDGSFLFAAVAPGRYRLEAKARGYGDGSYAGVVTVAGGPVGGLELMLARARGAIRGRLRGIEPRDLTRAQVSAAPAAADPPSRQWRWRQQQVAGIVDESGAYAIGDLAPGAWTVVALIGAGRRAIGQVELVPDAAHASNAELDLVFEPAGGATLSGTVSNNGHPVAGVQVHVNRGDQAGGGQMETAADGSFRISGLAPGSYAVMALDMRTFVSADLAVELTGDQEIAIDFLTGQLQGRVVSAATGQPIAGAAVSRERLDRPAFSMVPATSRADGAFDLGPVTAGRYRVTAMAPGFADGQATVEVAPEATASVDVQLAPLTGKP
jgi:protocatechuate 3,4-dioxygenase beta subunit